MIRRATLEVYVYGLVTAPAQKHATDDAVYTALFSFLSKKYMKNCDFINMDKFRLLLKVEFPGKEQYFLKRS